MSGKRTDDCWKIDLIANHCPKDNEIVDVQVGSGKDTVQAVHVSSLTGLIQSVGYLKYVSPSPVYFRGQRAVHESGLPKPSLYRGNISNDSREERIKFYYSAVYENDDLDSSSLWQPFITSQNKGLTSQVLSPIGANQHIVEPLLQHYGLPTRWIDLTNSLPYALFFSLAFFGKRIKTLPINDGYDALSNGTSLSRIFKNVPVALPNDPFDLPVPEHVYLYALCFGEETTETDKRAARGEHRMQGGYVMDLREAIPSIYLRPHAQHGLVFSPHSFSEYSECPLFSPDSPCRGALFQIDSRDVIRWLGKGELFVPSSIFPPVRAYRTPKKGAKRDAIVTIDQGLWQIENRLIARGRESSFTSDNTLKCFSQLINYISFDTFCNNFSHQKKGKGYNADWDAKDDVLNKSFVFR